MSSDLSLKFAAFTELFRVKKPDNHGFILIRNESLYLLLKNLFFLGASYGV